MSYQIVSYFKQDILLKLNVLKVIISLKDILGFD